MAEQDNNNSSNSTVYTTIPSWANYNIKNFFQYLNEYDINPVTHTSPHHELNSIQHGLEWIQELLPLAHKEFCELLLEFFTYNKKENSHTTHTIRPIGLRCNLDFDYDMEHITQPVQFGNADYQCQACGAFLFEDETKIGQQRKDQQTFAYCCNHGVLSTIQLPDHSNLPDEIKNLFNVTEQQHAIERQLSNHFLTFINSFNNSLSFSTTFSSTEKEASNPQIAKFNKTKGSYVATLQGEMVTTTGPPLHNDTTKPARYASVYFSPGIDQVEYRLHHLQRIHKNKTSKKNLTKLILETLLRPISRNPLYKTYKLMVDNHTTTQHHYKVTFPSQLDNDRYFPNPSSHTASQFVSVLRPNEEQNNSENATLPPLTITTNDSTLQKLHQQHQLYEPLTFMLLHLDCIQPTYHIGLRDLDGNKITMASYFHYLLFTRDPRGTTLRHDLRFYTRNLFHKYLLNAYIRIEDYRLSFHKHNMFMSVKGLDTLSNIRSELQKNKQPQNFGKRVISSNYQTSASRYRKLTSSAMALVSAIQASSLFITLTLNPEWSAIRNNLKPNQKPAHRPDICARVFRLYSTFLLNYMKHQKPFGSIAAVILNTEFQTRGNAHQHISLFLDQSMSTTLIDSTLSNELPDPHLQPRLFALVVKYMLHPKHTDTHRLCLRNGECRFGFPKQYRETTTFEANTGFHLRRRNNGRKYMRNGQVYDNRDVVTYSPHLLLLLESHLNVLYCSTSTHVAYSLKYSLKCFRHDEQGGDVVFANVSTELTQQTEAHRYQQFRFITSPEASYRLMKHNKHTIIWPATKMINIHLPGNQSVAFNCNAKRIKLTNRETTSELTAYFQLLQHEERNPLPIEDLLTYPPATQLTILGVAQHYTFNQTSKTWTRRKRYQDRNCVAYLRHVDVKHQELYHLRLILLSQPVKSFEDAKTHQGQLYPTYVEAAKAKGLTDRDTNILGVLQEASMFVSPRQLRNMFITLLTNSISILDIRNVWDEVVTILSQDFAYQRLRRLNFMPTSSNSSTADTSFQQFLETNSDDTNNCLIALQKLLKEQGKSMSDYNLPLPLPRSNHTDDDTLRYNAWVRETFNPSPLNDHEMDVRITSLNEEQLVVFNEIVNYCFDTENDDNTDILPIHSKRDNSHLFQLQGLPGVGKSTLLNTMVHYFYHHERVALCASPSGIAATLLYGGSTMHSLFEIPLNITETTTLNISRQSFKFRLLSQTSLIIIDEISMTSCTVLSCLHRGLCALFQSDIAFAGIPVLMVGDTTQIPPVIEKGSPAQVIAESFLFWEQWETVKRKVYQLTTNVRVQHDPYRYKEYLHSLCWNTLPKYPSTGFGPNSVQLPHFVTLQSKLGVPLQEPLDLQDLIDWTFATKDITRTNITANTDSTVIITPLNSEIHNINSIVLRQLAPTQIEYQRITSRNEKTPNQHGFVTYFASTIIHDQLPQRITRTTIEELRYPGMPLHQLNIAIGSPILLLRNINKKRGLCNGTRLRVTRLLKNSIIAVILNGNKANIGTTVAIPRIDFQSKKHDSSLNVSFVRRQFPVTLAYAISINKSQGQTIQKVGIYLPQPVFTHGMLTVAMSRVTNPDNLAILIPPNNLIHGYADAVEGKHNAGIYTPHIVYEPLLNFSRNSSNDT